MGGIRENIPSSLLRCLVKTNICRRSRVIIDISDNDESNRLGQDEGEVKDEDENEVEVESENKDKVEVEYS